MFNFFSDATLQRQLIQWIVPAALCILFFQSAIDKIVDFRKNLDYFTGHFAKSILAKFISPMPSAIARSEGSNERTPSPSLPPRDTIHT